MILVILGSSNKIQVPVNYTISRGNNRYCEIHFFFFLAKITLSRRGVFLPFKSQYSQATLHWVNLGTTIGGNVTSLLIVFEIVFFPLSDIKHIAILVHLSHFVLIL